jgi:hypothetical protein
MPIFIGTFGGSHGYSRCFTEIEADTKEEAEEEMQRRYQGYWSMVYPSREAAGVEEHNLIQIEPGVRPPFEKFGTYALQSWLIERGVPCEHTDTQERLAELATDYWQEN